MTKRQEALLKAMNLPEKEEAVIRAIVALLDEIGDGDDDLKRRVLATANHYAQSEGFFD